jgi:hypothetical protein
LRKPLRSARFWLDNPRIKPPSSAIVSPSDNFDK